MPRAAAKEGGILETLVNLAGVRTDPDAPEPAAAVWRIGTDVVLVRYPRHVLMSFRRSGYQATSI